MSFLEAERLLALARDELARGRFLDSYLHFEAAWISGSVASDNGADIHALRALRARISDFVVHTWTPRALEAVPRSAPGERANQLRAIATTFLQAADYLAREADEGRVVAGGKAVTRVQIESFVAETCEPIAASLARATLTMN